MRADEWRFTLEGGILKKFYQLKIQIFP